MEVKILNKPDELPIPMDTNKEEYGGNSKDKRGKPTSYTAEMRYGASIGPTFKKKVAHGRIKRDHKFRFNVIFTTSLSRTNIS